jgi:hypothetical protein
MPRADGFADAGGSNRFSPRVPSAGTLFQARLGCVGFNLIVDVEPGEAELLLKVVETLIDDTYIAREKREEHFAAVEALRQKKIGERAKPDPA